MTTTADDIDAAILAQLPAGGTLVCWTHIHRRVPGSFWEKQTAMLRLYWDGLIYAIKVGGTPYLGLGDEDDLAMVAKARAEGRVREIRVV